MNTFRFDPKGMTLRRASLACLQLLLPFMLSAAILQVPSGPFPTIKAAYNAAQSGDIIVIQPGLYLEMPPATFNNPNKLVLFQPASRTALITASNPPPNDAFASRTPLSGADFTVTAENYAAAAGLEANEPRTCRSVQCTFVLGRTVWFKWTAPANGLAIVSTFGSDFDAVLDVFKGSALPSLSCLFTELVWNETLNEVGFQAQEGMRYQIRVGGEDFQRGQIVLSVTMSAAPPNDHFAAAHFLTGDVTQVEGTSISATREDLEPNHDSAAASNSVWFTWTAPAGDAIASRPVAISTAGSDFDTVLAVYQGGAPGNLSPVVSNDDRSALDSPPARESQVTFTPTPGGTYLIALDGSRRHSQLKREQFGNYLLRLDYSMVNVSVQTLLRSPPANGTVPFQANLNVQDWGLAPTGPLRVRLAARNGRDFAGIHRAAAANETDLESFAVPAPNGLVPGESRSLTVSGVCPAPFVQDNVTNTVTKRWGVFAVLEELFAGEWITLDRTFLLYGLEYGSSQPQLGGIGQCRKPLSYGLSRPVPPNVAANEVNQLVGAGVRVSSYVTDVSTNQFSLIALLDDGREGLISNASWSAPAWIILAANGLLHVGDIPHTTNFTVIGRYHLGGVARNITDIVPIYKRPRLTLLPTATRNHFQYVVQGDWHRVFQNLSTPFALEYKDEFRANTAWQTNSVGTFNTFPVTNTVVGTNLNQRFYRLNVRPPQPPR